MYVMIKLINEENKIIAIETKINVELSNEFIKSTDNVSTI